MEEMKSFACQDCGKPFEVRASAVAFFAKQADQFNYTQLTTRCRPCNRAHIARVLSGPALPQVVEALAAG